MLIFEIIFPVFAIAAVGYLAAYKQILSTRNVDGISRFVFVILLPALLFTSMANMELPDQINWGFFLSYYLVVIAIYALGVLPANFGFQAP